MLPHKWVTWATSSHLTEWALIQTKWRPSMIGPHHDHTWSYVVSSTSPVFIKSLCAITPHLPLLSRIYYMITSLHGLHQPNKLLHNSNCICQNYLHYIFPTSLNHSPSKSIHQLLPLTLSSIKMTTSSASSAKRCAPISVSHQCMYEKCMQS